MTTALSLVRNDESSDTQATVTELRQQFAGAAREIESLACAHAGDFKSFEQELVRAVWALARVALALFFAHRHQRCVVPARLERAGCGFRPKPITDSGASRSLIPVEADHRFRSKPIAERIAR